MWYLYIFVLLCFVGLLVMSWLGFGSVILGVVAGVGSCLRPAHCAYCKGDGYATASSFAVPLKVQSDYMDGRDCGRSEGQLHTNVRWKDEKESPMMWGVKWDWDWDKGYTGGTVENATGPDKKILRQIIMIRHGQYHHEKSRSDGLEPNRLTPLGFEQGYQTGVFLAQQVEQAAEKTRTVNQLAKEKKALNAFNAKYKGEEIESSPDLKEKQEELKRSWKAAYDRNAACGSLLISPHIRTMYVSNMIRAKQTMDSLLQGMKDEFKKCGKEFKLPPLVTDETLVERFPCPVEPPTKKAPTKTKGEVVVAAEDVFRRYFYRPERLSSTSLSSKAMSFLSSFSSFFSQYSIGAKYPSRFQDEDMTVDVLVMHSNMMRYMLLRALQLPPEAWMRLSTPHCSITSLKMSESGFINMFCYASCGHLLPHQITSRNTY